MLACTSGCPMFVDVDVGQCRIPHAWHVPVLNDSPQVATSLLCNVAVSWGT